MFIHRLSGPDLQVSTCSKLYFVLVFKCLYTDYQDHTYKLVHVVNYKLYFVLVFKCLYTDYQDQTYKLVYTQTISTCRCGPDSLCINI